MVGNTSTVGFPEYSVDAHKLQRRAQITKVVLRVLLVCNDVAMLSMAFVVGYYARLRLPLFPVPDGQPPLRNYIPTLLLHVVVIVLMFYFNRLYHQRRSSGAFDQLRQVASTVTFGAVMVYGMQELIFRNSIVYELYPRSMFVYAWFGSVLFVIVGREFHRGFQRFLRQRGLDTENLLVIGGGRIAREVTGKILKTPQLGYRIIGILARPQDHQGKMLGVPVLGTFDRLPDVIDEYHIQQVIIALPDVQRSELVDLVTRCQRGLVDIKVYPDIFAYMAGDLNVHDLGGTPLLTVRDVSLRGWKLSLKRGMDVLGASVGLVILSPILLLTALLLYLEDRGPVFYTQQRMGLDGRPFPMIKFRSMRVDADKMADWTVENDPRVTRIGRFMRRTNWDEIPQLVNVLLGHMSLVGPRPEQPQYVRQFREQIPRYMERHREKAGMTGWAQVNGLRGDTSIARRTAYDLWYVENWSLWLDVKIILRTIVQTVTGKNQNAY